ncbi:1,4-alpha-glucan branching protein [Flavisolibacter tropicus]|uniref:1,4-alpha-glucan branching protein n=1 Tax=Flavisolibacter tropicus TaxID=1492898 RepID=A0A172U2U7_9BACT|nr:1,4-alpha-glucan branching protein [Flavisolibacter tropicus]
MITSWLAACNSNSVTNNNQERKMEYTANKDWIKTTNIYEVNVRQYTKEGTFNAFKNELPRLKEMGVETLWFMPITPISQKNKKGTLGSPYACSDYTAINPEFGTFNDFKNLVKEAHAQGFKVIIDWVANHTGWDHRWTKEHPDWFLKDSATNDFKIASGMDDIIELDYKNPQMRQAMIDAMKFWVQEAGIDGFRCDLAFWVELDFWLEAKKELDKVRPLFWLAETDPLDNPEYMQVFDAAYTWTWMHKSKDFYQQHLPLESIDSVLNRYNQAPGMKAWFTANHDENSWNGTEYEKYGDAAKALAVFSSTWQGVPLVYSGQELPNHKRLEFFEKDTIAWNGKNELAPFYKTLFGLRKNHPALNAEVSVNYVQTSEPHNVLAYSRTKGEKQVVVVLNLSRNGNLNVNLTDSHVGGTYRNAFTNSVVDLTSNKQLLLQPWEYVVLEK